MKPSAFLSTAALLFAACSSASVAAPEADDEFQTFFAWWNEAFQTPGAFTAENFSEYLTEDATLTLEGETVINGVDEWATHFQRIQAGGGEVELVVPFKEAFKADDKIYTYHVIRSRRDGEVGCSLAAGHADMEGDKIAAITLVRQDLDMENGPVDPECWTE
ncbi:hypothetical protein B5C34_09015 [Pacificimonas flava]|uniref:SnoaL-like domain-containing protein n=2 Tax=Pacificimonas TaxID=1960290 RepID=A0A219B5G2_9SPHN|nr:MULTISPECIES: hypothetical protein [Pacificimonas]MBZ6379190.1 hypothetical protein [Pacificimonas aurantium]OWV33587.1 hypothetical protein B5C34_09015 [Pacificimonas flava]